MSEALNILRATQRAVEAMYREIEILIVHGDTMSEAEAGAYRINIVARAADTTSLHNALWRAIPQMIEPDDISPVKRAQFLSMLLPHEGHNG